MIFSLPTKEEIIKEIELCRKAAVATATKVGLIDKTEPNKKYECGINPSTEKQQRKLKVNGQSKNKNTHTMQLKHLKNIQLIDYTGKIKEQLIDETSPYTEIICSNEKKIIVKKTSLCWLFNVDSKKISSDRLQRVRYSEYPKKCNSKILTKLRAAKCVYKYKPCHKKKLLPTRKQIRRISAIDDISDTIEQMSICKIKEEKK